MPVRRARRGLCSGTMPISAVAPKVRAERTISSINQHQAVRSSDGRVRLVVAHGDPGVPNWLDTGGHAIGLLTFRWFWPNSDPSPVTRVVGLDELASVLPADTPKVDARQRAEDVRARKAHLAWRFRT